MNIVNILQNNMSRINRGYNNLMLDLHLHLHLQVHFPGHLYTGDHHQNLHYSHHLHHFYHLYQFHTLILIHQIPVPVTLMTPIMIHNLYIKFHQVVEYNRASQVALSWTYEHLMFSLLCSPFHFRKTFQFRCSQSTLWNVLCSGPS